MFKCLFNVTTDSMFANATLSYPCISYAIRTEIQNVNLICDNIILEWIQKEISRRRISMYDLFYCFSMAVFFYTY